MSEIYCPKCGHKFRENSFVWGKLGGAAAGAVAGAKVGAGIGIVGGPWGGIAGTVPGAIIGGACGLFGGHQIDKNKCPSCGHRF